MFVLRASLSALWASREILSHTHREILFIHGGIARGSAESLCSKEELATTSAGSI